MKDVFLLLGKKGMFVYYLLDVEENGMVSRERLKRACIVDGKMSVSSFYLIFEFFLEKNILNESSISSDLFGVNLD